MTQVVSCRVVDRVAVLTIDNPPVNALGHGVRAGLAAALAVAVADAAVDAIVIRAAGRTFPAGADIREFGTEPRTPILAEVCAQVAASDKPVVAAMHGTILGGGLELALAAHVRMCLEGAAVGFPEILLGLLPGAGGTQRAPRLAGAAAALRLMLSGARVSAAEGVQLGLIDIVVAATAEDIAANRAATGLEAAAITAAVLAAAHPDGLPVPALLRPIPDPAAFRAEIEAARTALPTDALPAHGLILDCVAAALTLPVAEALAFERDAFVACVGSAPARALRHVFMAERHAARFVPKGAVHGFRAVAATGGLAVDTGEAVLRAAAAAGIRVVEAGEEGIADLIFDSDRRRLMLCRAGPAATHLLLGGERLAEVIAPDDSDAAALGALAQRLGLVPVRSVAGGLGAPILAAFDGVVTALRAAGAGDADIVGAQRSIIGGGSDVAGPPGGAMPAVRRACLAVMAHAALVLRSNGAARSMSDIDVVLILGHGFARAAGGLTQQIDAEGVPVLVAELAALRAAAPDLWPDPRLIAEVMGPRPLFGDLADLQ